MPLIYPPTIRNKTRRARCRPPLRGTTDLPGLDSNPDDEHYGRAQIAQIMASAEQPSVIALLQGARAGDARERERLFEACRGYLGLVARAQVESWLQAKVDASDIVQETLLEAHRDFHRFQGTTEGEWLAWLRRILSHNAADYVRRFHGTAKRQARRETRWQQAVDSSASIAEREPAAPDETPSQQVMRHDRELAVAAALAQLPEDYREVIMLRNLQRLPFDEVAQRMGRSRPAAQMLWARAIKKLQLSLDD